MHRHLCIPLLFALSLLGSPKPSNACGLTPPIGPSGLPAICHGDEAKIRIRVGAVIGGTSTRIDFSDQTASLLQAATSATVDVLPFERLTLSGALGASLPGRVEYRAVQFDLRPGPMAGVGVAYRLFGGAAPFVHTSFTLSLSRSTTRAPDGSKGTFTSRDYRFGLAVGKTLGHAGGPKARARATPRLCSHKFPWTKPLRGSLRTDRGGESSAASLRGEGVAGESAGTSSAPAVFSSADSARRELGSCLRPVRQP